MKRKHPICLSWISKCICIWISKCICIRIYNVFVSHLYLSKKAVMFQRRAPTPLLPPMCVLTTEILNIFVFNFKLYLYQNLICICVIFEMYLSKQKRWCFSGALRPPPPSDVCLNQADSVIQWRYTCSPSSLCSLIWLSAVQKCKKYKYSCMSWCFEYSPWYRVFFLLTGTPLKSQSMENLG